ncbi:MAG: ParA family protein [Candidatus Bathyarchaeota archaeon]|nr:ParA family protein [Candidatus Bathyarchaeota archaeon]
MKVVALFNIKGGVGKTAAAVNLAHLSSIEGCPTLIWDLDPQAATTFYLRVKPKIKGGSKKLLHGRRSVGSAIKGTDFFGFDLLPGDFSFRKLDRILEDSKHPNQLFERILKTLGKQYQHLFLDCAPGMSIVSETVFKTADALLVPTIPTPLSIRTLAQLERYLKKVGRTDLPVLPFFSMVDRRKALHRSITLEAQCQCFRYLETAIPYASVVEKMGLYREPVTSFSPACQASMAFKSLWREVRTRLYP